MYAQLAYGAWFVVLRVTGRQRLKHRLSAPEWRGSEFRYGGTEKEQAELRRAQALYPSRHMYLGIGSEYSPWYGTRARHTVRVLVTDHKGTPPTRRYGDANAWGMEWGRFLETEWVTREK